MKKTIKKIIVAICLMCFSVSILGFGSARAVALADNDDLNISAKSALLIDYDSEKVVYEKNASERLPIASMTKIASLAVIFDAIDKGIIKENDSVMVSENAASVGGSSAFLDAGSSYKVTDLIKTVIIASANDSTVALAEHLSGSEEIFVSKMNKLADSLKLSDTHFVNSTGLPVENHYSSALDISKIYRQICNNKIYRKYSKIWMDDFIHPSGRKTGLVNTNRLVRTFDGIEGGKTGYTDTAKFCLTASASRGTTRLISVIIGAGDSKTRFMECSKLFSYGFSNFETKVVVSSEIPVTISTVKKSNQKIEIYPERSSNIFTEKSSEKTFTTDFKLLELVAPIKSGDIVGKLYVFDENNMVVDEINLVSKTNAPKENLREILSELISLW